MGTGNFYYRNILAVIPNSEQEWFDEDDLAWKEDSICDELKKKYSKNKLIEFQRTGKFVENYPIGRNFGGKSICRLFLYLWEKDYVWFDIIVYNGYYSGLNIDYEVTANPNNYSEEHLMNNPSVIKAEDTIKKIIKKYTDAYRVSARFSSGETWYEKAE